MADTMTSQNVELTSWDTLYIFSIGLITSLSFYLGCKYKILLGTKKGRDKLGGVVIKAKIILKSIYI
jgi:hypothetical protein